MDNKIWRNTVSARHVASVGGVRYAELIDSIGLRTLNGRIERYEARRALTHILIHTKDEGRKPKLRAAIKTFADKAETD